MLLSIMVQQGAFAIGSKEIPQECQKLLSKTDERKLVSFWSFPGGEMDPADMVFYSDGLLALNSNLYSKDREVKYFIYRRDSENREVSIIFCDPSLSKYMRIEADKIGRGVIKIDEKSKTIVYAIKNDAIEFQGWYFYEHIH